MFFNTLTRFVALRLTLRKSGSFASFITTISIIAVSISLAVMIISVSMVHGFQTEIKRKLFDFWGHAHILNYDNNTSFNNIPIPYPLVETQDIKKLKNIKSVDAYIEKAGIIKTKNNIEGIVLKSIYNTTQFNNFITQGSNIDNNDTTKNQIVISSTTASRLQLKVNDAVIVYFIENASQPKARKFNIVGIYNTGMSEYDKVYALCNMPVLQQLNSWSDTLVSGYQLSFNNIENIDTQAQYIEQEILPMQYLCKTIREINPNIFDWLSLQNTNVVVIITLMAIVAMFNAVNMLLILILERTQMIGMFKAMGMTNIGLRNIFISIALRIIVWGVLIGNIVGLGLCFIQKHFSLIKLPEESYYLSIAPILINPIYIFVINIVLIILIVFALLIPSWLINRINPIQAIHFR